MKKNVYVEYSSSLDRKFDSTPEDEQKHGTKIHSDSIP
jgi:hypothetical protein